MVFLWHNQVINHIANLFETISMTDTTNSITIRMCCNQFVTFIDLRGLKLFNVGNSSFKFSKPFPKFFSQDIIMNDGGNTRDIITSNLIVNGDTVIFNNSLTNKSIIPRAVSLVFN